MMNRTVKDSTLIKIMQKKDPNFDVTINTLKRYTNTVVNVKRFNSWINSCNSYLKRHCILLTEVGIQNRIISIINNLVGFNIVVKTRTRFKTKEYCYWVPEDLNNTILIEKKTRSN